MNPEPVEWAVGDPSEFNCIYIRKVFGSSLPIQPFMYKVMKSSWVLSKDGQWEDEPLPSSRDEEFYARSRYETFEEALAAAYKKQGLK